VPVHVLVHVPGAEQSWLHLPPLHVSVHFEVGEQS